MSWRLADHFSFRVLLSGLAAALLALLAGAGCRREDGRPQPEPLRLVVMDPLAKELACACVAGHAQRQYSSLAAFLERRLQRPIRVTFGEDLERALGQNPTNRLALIIGKESVVRHDARVAQLPLNPIARLTDPEGRTTLTGLFLVKAGDPAHSLPELKGRRVLFGPVEAEEKHAAAIAALHEAGVDVPAEPITRGGCTDAALDVVECKEEPGSVGVISSYALPLLEGCGTIERGSLRVVGVTPAVPFITAFVPVSLEPTILEPLRAALLAVRSDPALLRTLESRDGFVAWHDPQTTGWPGWRGPDRDGRAEWLPETLPAEPPVSWRRPLSGISGLAGIAATPGHVVVADRDPMDERDVFRCFRASDGAPLWQVAYPCSGRLDYGMSPRATPVIRDDRVWLLGALGRLQCVELDTGRVVWSRDLAGSFAVPQPKWGFCSTPLLDGSRLIVNPGATGASLAALRADTGETLWQCPGAPAAYASFIVGYFGGRRQLIGYDQDSLGGWEPETGRRLWKLVPPENGDFNVPTPIDYGGQLLVATENNGTRLYDFGPDGAIRPTPLAINRELAPDTSTPVVTAGHLFGCMNGLHCLDPAAGLNEIWHHDDGGFSHYASLMVCGDRLLATTHSGELVLIHAAVKPCVVRSRLRVFPEGAEVYAHPAIVGHRLYWRDAVSLVCLEFSGG